ncbi:MAG: polysaccharide biosynthesis C-terminal domain-containing protein, partial [Microcystaceae cyanobacterium]
YPLVNFLLGKAYQESATILILHIWALPFVCLGVARGQWLIAENYTQFNFWATALGALSNILLNLILIPAYEGVGAAIATVISYAISAYFSCLLYRPSYEMFKMLTKALFVPFRVQQNLYYLEQIRNIIQTKNNPK